MNNYAQHIESICKYNNISIGTHSGGGRAWRKSRHINIRPVKSAITYAVAIHEIGHILGDKQSSYRIEKETYAWKWAIDNAMEWTPSMQAKMKKCLSSYLEWALRNQNRKNAPVIPDDCHIFWDLL